MNEIAILAKEHHETVMVKLRGYALESSGCGLSRKIDPALPWTIPNSIGLPFGDLSSDEIFQVRAAWRHSVANPPKLYTGPEIVADDALWEELFDRAQSPEHLEALRKIRGRIERDQPLV